MKLLWQFLTVFFFLLVMSVLGAVLALGYVAYSVSKDLPSLEKLTDYRPKIPLRIYSREGLFLGQYGEEKRTFVLIPEVPWRLKAAVLAIEDSTFYTHHGVDPWGVVRAVIANLRAGGLKQGASTITMQVARNFYLTPKRNFTRKITEALLAMKIEKNLSKDKILEIYLNQIFLGQRNYGFAAAAKDYFGKKLGDLTLAEAALLAGIPKAPSRFNPVADPKAALERRNQVLARLQEVGWITQEDFRLAVAEPLEIREEEAQGKGFDAPYAAEMARVIFCGRVPDCTTGGYRVFTTISARHQETASSALVHGLENYELRHGYRGPEKHARIDLLPAKERLNLLAGIPPVAGAYPALVLAVKQEGLEVLAPNGRVLSLLAKDLPYGWKKKLQEGDIVRLREEKGQPRLVQPTEVEGAVVSLDPEKGAILALAGGYDFGRNKFNRAAQAWRQPGSSFKPFIYSAALERGFTPASLLDDSPFSAPLSSGGKMWVPHNYDNGYSGPITMREALVRSKNLATIHLMASITPAFAQNYILRFGFSKEKNPPYLSLALGAGSVTPLQMAAGYAVFANGGYRVTPYIIDRVEDDGGKVLARTTPAVAGVNAERVIDARNAFIITEMLADVVLHGTAARAASLGRPDLAGKTGTTNDFVDSWFAGYTPKHVAVVWVGYDDSRNLGKGEAGSRVALPIWMDYMRGILDTIPVVTIKPPAGLVMARVDPETGYLSSEGVEDYFYREKTPPRGGNTEKILSGKVGEEIF